MDSGLGLRRTRVGEIQSEAARALDRELLLSRKNHWFRHAGVRADYYAELERAREPGVYNE